MTKDEIIRTAQEAGFDIGGDGLHAYHPDTRDELPLDTYLERFAALVAAHEREACLACYSPDDTATDWADKIRGRNEK